MPRPETTKDVPDRFVEMSTFHVNEILTRPDVLRHYVALMEAVKKAGGTVENEYGTLVRMKLPKSSKQLQDSLEVAQRTWDRMQSRYIDALNRNSEDVDIKEYERDNIIAWAAAEGKPNPFDVLSATDPDIQKIREEMGLR